MSNQPLLETNLRPFFGKVIAYFLPEYESKKTTVLQYSTELMCLVAGNGKTFMFSNFFTDSVYSLTVGCRKYPKKHRGGDVRTISRLINIVSYLRAIAHFLTANKIIKKLN